ncbi:peroxide stress protein YaaA [Ramlibacter tataouinensis]|uniref:peroxide stress protein YaaA n=1 Tax=Ramlibacter tataouinensis TaxID=94132 RepID=UPI0022F3A8C1|nr:peroxide stress protein YaaA [Ramlibacter tataouinensis]WBY00851.1 peroxide stress protein YaaA [Ramlibacter tataouinensis]
MLFLLSPAKTLDYESPLPELPHTLPRFGDRSQRLIAALRRKPAGALGELMSISPALAELNVARYRAWAPEPTADNARPAVLAFAGDVYEGLDAASLSSADLDWAQQHIRILSGLYGVLRPLDRMQPYRLEMGTALAVGRTRNLYQFWGGDIAALLDEELAAEPDPVVVNLASQEYFRSVDRRQLKARVVECVFEDWKGGQYKVISFFAKKARGLMARYAIRQRIRKPDGLQGFDLDGYGFDPKASSADRLVFRRKMQP